MSRAREKSRAERLTEAYLRIAELEAVLEPFVREANRIDPAPIPGFHIDDGCEIWQVGSGDLRRSRITYGDLRRARALTTN